MDYSTFGIFDNIQANLVNIAGEVDSVYTGKYMVTSRTRHVQGQSYRELITAKTQGVPGSAAAGGFNAAPSASDLLSAVQGVLKKSGFDLAAMPIDLTLL
jgi:hypothetical protein